ncbi:MAG TPA: phosphoesterase [Candidatus Syntrophoarchaeum butanivorans]|uniref:Phosphoesterase n=1 Tax=Candidatus Syntropharchaeum butanivorans TaxID=1839936 RepID=A0A7C0X189_9EURY|nr:phosphoesterase [Candidatus Syntrophoarchaeum butanivorans]
MESGLITVTHADADGVLSLATLMMVMGDRMRVYFSHPNGLLSTLKRIESEKLYIFDIAGSKESIIEAARSGEVLWIDHHIWEPQIRPENVSFCIDSSAKSACSLVSRYFNITAFEKIADEIDTNTVTSSEADKVRKIIGHFKGMKDSNRHFLHFAKKLAERGLEALEDYREEIIAYEDELRSFEELVKRYSRVKQVNGVKIAVVRTPRRIPVYVAYNVLTRHDEAPFDIIIVTSRMSDRVELRTHTGYDVLRIARIFGGGGHRVASGARADVEDVLTAISFLK